MRIRSWHLGLVLAAGSCAFAQSVNVPDHVVEVYASGISTPSTMAFIGPDDILVLQKPNGWVRRLIGGVIQPVLALDVAVSDMSERGLLGIALDPDFVNQPYVYLYYTEAVSDGGEPLGNRVYRYTWNGSTLVDPRLVLDLPATPSSRHNGGIVFFGADDKLYTVVGDLDRTGKTENNAAGADPDDSAVILRTNSDGSAPPDNPFYDPAAPSSAQSRIFAYGVRNSFGMTADPLSGALWDTENGPVSFDEVNRIAPGTNSGWTRIMGPVARDPEGTADLWVAPGSSYSDPELSWSTTVAPTAIAFVRTPKLGCSQFHDLLVGDYNCGQLYHLRLSADRSALSFGSPELADLVVDNQNFRCSEEQAEIVFGAGFAGITDIETGPDGLVYVVSIDTGKIYRIVPSLPAAADPDADGVESACDCAPSNASAYGTPLEIPRLRLSQRAPTLVGWDAQSAEIGSGARYGLVTGSLAALRQDHGFASACTLASGLATPHLADARMPTAGSGFYYLARASNACGNGSFGDGSGPVDARDALDLASLSPCP